MAALSEITGGGVEPGEPGSVIGPSGLLISWTPTSTDPDEGGPDSVNPLLTVDGACAIDPEWAEPRGHGVTRVPAVLASAGRAGGAVHARELHARGGTRRVTLSWSQASGVDVELVRRALQVTRCGAGRTRFRHPILDPPGPVNTAPWIRFVGGSLRVKRSREGARAEMGLEIEYLEPQ